MSPEMRIAVRTLAKSLLQMLNSPELQHPGLVSEPPKPITPKGSPKPPTMGRHSSGQARITLNGKVHYLGLFGSPAAKQAYVDLIAKWDANGRRPIDPDPAAVPEPAAAVKPAAEPSHPPAAWWANERQVRMSVLPNHLVPNADGTRVTLPTVYRWTTHGIQGQKLRRFRIGGAWGTTLEEVARWQGRMSGGGD